MLFKLGYRFEMNINPNVTSEIYSHDESLEGADDATIKAAAEKKLADWREDASGTIYNNYISAGLLLVNFHTHFPGTIVAVLEFFPGNLLSFFREVAVKSTCHQRKPGQYLFSASAR